MCCPCSAAGGGRTSRCCRDEVNYLNCGLWLLSGGSSRGKGLSCSVGSGALPRGSGPDKGFAKSRSGYAGSVLSCLFYIVLRCWR